jgi:type IV pilus assembly protein PilV
MIGAIRKAAARGFTLVETLIALTVLSVGLLGAAATLLDSMHVQSQSLRRAAATDLLRDMSERIRANPAAAARYATAAAVAPPGQSSCEAAACDSTRLAAADLAHFTQAADALLPRGNAAIVEFAPATGADTLGVFVISLRWQDPRSDDAETVTLRMLTAPVAG